MEKQNLNNLARMAGQYPPPLPSSEDKQVTRESPPNSEGPLTWSDRIDYLIELAANFLVGLFFFFLKVSGLVLIFWTAHAVYPDNFLDIPLAQMTLGTLLRSIGSLLLAAIGTLLLLTWVNKSSDKS
jgi:hypothetical protein